MAHDKSAEECFNLFKQSPQFETQLKLMQQIGQDTQGFIDPSLIQKPDASVFTMHMACIMLYINDCFGNDASKIMGLAEKYERNFKDADPNLIFGAVVFAFEFVNRKDYNIQFDLQWLKLFPECLEKAAEILKHVRDDHLEAEGGDAYDKAVYVCAELGID